MSRLNGILAGFILTSFPILYASHVSRQNILLCRDTLRDSTDTFEALLKPRQEPRPRQLWRETRPSFAETCKDTWNREVEGVVRWVQEAKWRSPQKE